MSFDTRLTSLYCKQQSALSRCLSPFLPRVSLCSWLMKSIASAEELRTLTSLTEEQATAICECECDCLSLRVCVWCSVVWCVCECVVHSQAHRRNANSTRAGDWRPGNVYCARAFERNLLSLESHHGLTCPCKCSFLTLLSTSIFPLSPFASFSLSLSLYPSPPPILILFDKRSKKSAPFCSREATDATSETRINCNTEKCSSCCMH